jgi:spore maturation protein CgeB
MKIAIVTILYKSSIKDLYAKNSALASLPYHDQKKIVDSNISLWASSWEQALTAKGYEVFTIPVNVVALQRKWANDHGVGGAKLHTIVFEQLKQYQPDVLWYDYFDIPLLKQIRSSLPSLKLVLGWTGSALVNVDILRETDLVLSCAPETVEKLNRDGVAARHLHHAFNPAVLDHPALKSVQQEYELSFIGQIFRGDDYHRRRERLLKKIIHEYDLKIFTPMFDYGLKHIVSSAAKKVGYLLVLPFSGIANVRRNLEQHIYLNEIMKANREPIIPYDHELKTKAMPAVYGVDMYKTIMQSAIVLNIHADSSSRFASNMRLFETTGAGACLLTDWKENLQELFNDGSEVVSYRSDEECLEKIKWLLHHPIQRGEIGMAGRKRILKEHTYNHRAEEWISIVKNSLSQQ